MVVFYCCRVCVLQHVVLSAFTLSGFLFVNKPLVCLRSGVGARRKSNVVKEIEKIKIKRDERRAVQLAMREKVESYYDTSDPNWEFKAMIK